MKLLLVILITLIQLTQTAIVNLEITQSDFSIKKSTISHARVSQREVIAPDDYVLLPMDDHYVTLDTVVIKHPLNIRYEYPNGNEIGSTVIKEKKNSVVVKFVYNPRIKYLRLTDSNFNPIKTIVYE